MKKILLASLLAMPLFFACKKDPNPTKPVKPNATETSKTLHCYPWRDVYGYTSLCNELNVFAICGLSDCSGGSVTTPLTNNSLADTNGDPYLFSSDEQITISRQNEIRSQAAIWAAANTPTGGYFVSGITYQIPPGAWTTSATGLGITVTYRKCTGGGGGAS
jgi:hypothetical protein